MINSVIEYMACYVLLCLTVSGLVSGWLYSNLLVEFKEWWIKFFGSKKNILLNKLQHYGICALCVGVPTTLMIEWLFMPFTTVAHYILLAVSVSFVSWLLSSFTLFCINGKYALELIAKDIEAHQK